MEAREALRLARALLREHGLEDWQVTLDRAKTRAGSCRFHTRTITLSRALTELHSEAEVRETILHEIAAARLATAPGGIVPPPPRCPAPDVRRPFRRPTSSSGPTAARRHRCHRSIPPRWPNFVAAACRSAAIGDRNSVSRSS